VVSDHPTSLSLKAISMGMGSLPSGELLRRADGLD
jgi:hypothetical protein